MSFAMSWSPGLDQRSADLDFTHMNDKTDK